MWIISRKKLREHWKKPGRGDSEQALKAWFAEAKAANWSTPADVKAKYGSASILRNGRVVFNICGNNYRLVVRISYGGKIVYVRFVGTHPEYDDIDAENV